MGDVKRGRFYRKATVKHHALITDSYRIVAVVVTDGSAGDSPAPTGLCAGAPRGDGCLLGDSAYCSRESCRLAASIGRRPRFRPKKNFVAHGMDEWGRMLARCRDRPAGSTGSMADETRSKAASRRSWAGSISEFGP